MLLHRRGIYKVAHKVHHDSLHPTPQTGTSVNLIEAFSFYAFFFTLTWLPPAERQTKMEGFLFEGGGEAGVLAHGGETARPGSPELRNYAAARSCHARLSAAARASTMPAGYSRPPAARGHKRSGSVTE